MQTHIFDRVWIAFAVCVIPWLLHTGYGLAQGYSYWIDELFSVVVAQEPWQAQFEIFLQDVHPPLYQIVLSVWTALFGASEAATRLLSALFCAGALTFAISIARATDRATGSIFILLFLSNWLTFFYAQEARAYGLLLFLSTGALFFFLTNRYRWLVASLLALGLTHFFGLLFALLCGAWVCVERPSVRLRLATVALLGLCLSWPALFVLIGDGQDVVGGNFWIETRGLAVLPEAIDAGWPQATYLLATLDPFRIWSALVLLLIIAVASAVSLRRNMHRGMGRDTRVLKCLYLTLAAILAVIVISFHTPVSTTRNFIILVGPMSFLLAAMTANLLQATSLKITVLAGLAILFVLGHLTTVQKLQNRYAPLQDWKRVAADVASLARDQNTTQVFAFEDVPKPVYAERFAFYLPDALEVRMVPVEDLKQLSVGSIVMFAHLPHTTAAGRPCGNAFTDALLTEGIALTAHFAEQKMRCRNGYAIIQ